MDYFLVLSLFFEKKLFVLIMRNKKYKTMKNNEKYILSVFWQTSSSRKKQTTKKPIEINIFNTVIKLYSIKNFAGVVPSFIKNIDLIV